MLAWVAAACLAGAAAVAGGWSLRRVDVLGRRRPFPWFSVVALVVLGLAAGVPWLLRVRLEARLGTVATGIAGTPVEVRCQSFGQAFVDVGAELGYVRFDNGTPQPWTLIKRDGCDSLSDYVRSDKERPTEPEIVAVHTLTHEAIHLRGIADEAITECLAVQHDALTAELLGASPEGARRLAAVYWETMYPLMPPGYKSADCAPGGALDAGIAAAPWASPSP